MNDKLIIAQVLTDSFTVDLHDVSLAEKWDFVRHVLGGSGEVDIMHDFSSDDFKEAYTSEDVTIVNAYLFVAQLRNAIFSKMCEYENHEDKDLLEIGQESSAVWAQKMYDKSYSIGTGEPLQHLWLN
jgi:hypothetical protein